MKFKPMVEIILLIILVATTMRMFLVDELIGCIYFIVNMILISLLCNYGTLLIKISTKIEELNNK